ncbi:undecaprenyl-phosphate glucose phosphotransferase [Methylomonas paludis]|uniref:Undecaprenyl-phosphate glucose phosphotransferase n=1 Tax=Methylomonas paludis TaxID=1173101 RepID=A0A975MLW8_9GAMM|nr:undecaprenyl-phosphate glucose phosphotransferase [Methylomonas paludis]QWF70019.1 undecaprenyl-phosphate glucose phosphotransferase [Methylomonas paludis]
MNQNRSKGFIRPLQPLQGLKRAMDTGLIFIMLYAALRVSALPLTTEYLALFIVCTVLYGIFAEQHEIYYGWRGDPMFDVAMRILMSWVLAFAIVISCLFMFDFGFAFSKEVLEIWLPLTSLGIISLHTIRRLIMSHMHALGINVRTYAVLGANKLGQRLDHAISEMPWLGYKCVGFFDDRYENSERCQDIHNPDRVIGGFKDLLEQAQLGNIDHIYVTLPLRAEKRVNQLINELADSTVSVNIVPDFFTFNLMHSKLSSVKGIPVVSVFDTPLNSALDGFYKRFEDLLLCAIILPLIAIPMAIIGAAVRLTSPGPAIFKQKRYGVNGEEIEVWKFRSMTVTENGATVTQATVNDRRVTRLGGILRRTSLDELPQFINVLQGRMSVVGPRPHAIAHNEFYRKQIQGYMLRHKMKPGITGLAQINGCRGETDTIEKMQMRIHYDLEYIRHWSVFLDLKLVFLTIFKGFVSEQAY